MKPQDNYGLDQVVASEELADGLAHYVRERFNEAEQHRQGLGIDARMLRNLRANRCEYQPDEVGLLGPYNDVYIGIAALKARAAESWLKDIVLNDIEWPWTLDPTPSPDMPQSIRDMVIDLLLRELPTVQGVEALRDRAKQLKGAGNALMMEEASRASGRMTTVIKDQMTEGYWVGVFGRLIADLCVYPSVFIRGPLEVMKAHARWVGDKFDTTTKATPISRNINSFDAYPAPNSSSPQDGDYFIEVATLASSDVYDLIGVPGFNEGNVRLAIADYAEGFDLRRTGGNERDRLEDKHQDTVGKRGVMETIIYNGKLPGSFLIEHGVIVPDPQKHYEAEVYVLGDYTLRAVLTPDPAGRRPVDSTSFRKHVGSIWGESTIDLAYEANRVCNAQARALVRNMSYSSGPIGEVVADRVSDTQDPTEIFPFKVALVGPDLSGTGAPAYRFHNINSVASELLAVFSHYMKLADDLTGIPAYVLGNPNVAGAGRTMGGLAMLMGNAAKGIKAVQLNVDLDIIAPHVGRYVVYNLVRSKDDSIKTDARVRARGATGLLQRELAQTRTVELLQLMSPYIEKWEQLPDGIKIMLREVLKNTGMPVDDIIPDPNGGEDTRSIMGLFSNQLPAMNRGAGQPVPLPPQSVPQLGQPLSPRTPAVINMPQGA